MTRNTNSITSKRVTFNYSYRKCHIENDCVGLLGVDAIPSIICHLYFIIS